jgi:hypothetical protein
MRRAPVPGIFAATWAIGLPVGIELLFAGSSLIATALDGHELAGRRWSALPLQ